MNLQSEHYSQLVIQHFRYPKNVGKLPVSDNVISETSGVPGRTSVISLSLSIERDRIIQARFLAHGCGVTIAVASLMTEFLTGMMLEHARQLTVRTWVQQLSLPKRKLSCAIIAQQALEQALDKWRMKKRASMAITLSEQAAEHIHRSIEKRGRGVGLRLKITNTGCSGFSYVTDYADEITATDQVFESHGAKVVVDDKSLPLINGTHVDYQKVGINWNYVFENPLAVANCGCGESFSVDVVDKTN